jgi:hypothetical protein
MLKGNGSGTATGKLFNRGALKRNQGCRETQRKKHTDYPIVSTDFGAVNFKKEKRKFTGENRVQPKINKSDRYNEINARSLNRNLYQEHAEIITKKHRNLSTPNRGEVLTMAQRLKSRAPCRSRLPTAKGSPVPPSQTLGVLCFPLSPPSRKGATQEPEID